MLRTLLAGPVLLLLTLSLTLSWSLSCASTPDAPDTSDTSEDGFFSCDGPRENLLWEVPHAQGSLHLFGSIHIGRAEFYPLAEPIESAFASADHLVLEIDPSSVETMEVAMDMARRGMLPPGQTLADIVAPDVRARVLELATEAGLPAMAVDRMRPWMIAITLSATELQRMGYAPEDGVEFHLLSQLGERDVLELETIEEQLALFENLDGPTFLDYTLESLDEGRDMTVKLMNAWYCGNVDDLVELMLEPDDAHADEPAYVDFMEKMFYARNEGMAEGIAELLERPGHYFVVVGAGHLIGDRGVPALLRARGLDVERR